MAQFRVRIPSGVVELVDMQTGQVLTLSAQDGPIDLGIMNWEWSRVTTLSTPSPLEETDALATLVPDVQEDDSPIESYACDVDPDSGLAPLPLHRPEPSKVVTPELAQAPIATSPRPYMPLLDAPLHALTEEDFTRYLESKEHDRGQWYWDDDDEALFVAVQARLAIWKKTPAPPYRPLEEDDCL